LTRFVPCPARETLTACCAVFFNQML
jgi:hypothetical protein